MNILNEHVMSWQTIRFFGSRIQDIQLRQWPDFTGEFDFSMILVSQKPTEPQPMTNKNWNNMFELLNKHLQVKPTKTTTATRVFPQLFTARTSLGTRLKSNSHFHKSWLSERSSLETKKSKGPFKERVFGSKIHLWLLFCCWTFVT